MTEKASAGGVAPSSGVADEFAAGLQQLTGGDAPARLSFGARLRNYFLTGLVIVGPVALTLYLLWEFVGFVDDWIKPLISSVLPPSANPDTYVPFAIPGLGLIVAIVGLTLVGALAANLLGRTLIGVGELLLGRMPIVRNVYRALKQIFESAVSAAKPAAGFQKVGLIEFPSKGIWSLVFVTGVPARKIAAAMPAPADSELLTVFMPTGVVPPTGFICFVPRQSVTLLDMTFEDAAKIIISGGMVAPGDAPRAATSAARTEP